MLQGNDSPTAAQLECAARREWGALLLGLKPRVQAGTHGGDRQQECQSGQLRRTQADGGKPASVANSRVPSSKAQLPDPDRVSRPVACSYWICAVLHTFKPPLEFAFDQFEEPIVRDFVGGIEPRGESIGMAGKSSPADCTVVSQRIAGWSSFCPVAKLTRTLPDGLEHWKVACQEKLFGRLSTPVS